MTDQTSRLVELYDQLIERLYETKLELEKSSQALDLEKEIERLAETEQEIERLTREEADLLTAWLKRDLQDLRSYLVETGKGVSDWLAQETQLLSEQFIYWLKQVADPSLLDARTLQEDLASRDDPTIYHTGELAMAGTFRCSSCDKKIQMAATHRLDACHRCDGRVFIRCPD
ncbi:zinc ribbon-containing protein [Marinospirillum insulare]|uniref:Zinc-ribbon containing domain-containing protein n=1 Tax=Marinospirillum insulare TaxID=217169 RepID=A0ABQ6A249_9GAMM|nr:hypothetical protein [Marinospirillum insulare]GLR64184.1 hypothetical protein GCM10007878_16220 [Marinospirillum insulare]